jgi:hypothetical protein
MKNIVKFLFAAMIIAAFSVNSSAQQASNVITASAEVFDVITVAENGNLVFGQLIVGQSKSVDVNGAVAHTGSGSVSEIDANVGRFIVGAGIGSNVNLTFTALPATLVGPEDATIDIVYTVDGTESAAWSLLGAGALNALSGTINRFVPGTGTSIEFPTNLIGEINAIYVAIGGTVTAGATQLRGVYQGTITLEASYN